MSRFINSPFYRAPYRYWVAGMGLYFLSFTSGLAATQTLQEFGDYSVHYNAFTSDTLQPAMAKAYGITRSKNRALLSISILKKSLSPLGTPVKAKLDAQANNLTGQWKKIDIREINDTNSVYYISEFRVAHEEVLNFTIDIIPEGSTEPLVLKFQQQFFTQ